MGDYASTRLYNDMMDALGLVEFPPIPRYTPLRYVILPTEDWSEGYLKCLFYDEERHMMIPAGAYWPIENSSNLE